MTPGRQTILIKDARILTMVDGQGEIAGDVLIEDGVIREIGQGLAAEGADVIDAKGGILMPGFVDTHRHIWQTQLRSTAGNWSLYDYLAEMRLTFSTYYTPDDVYLGNRIGAIDALNAGITTIVDHCHILNSPAHSDEAIRGLTDAGIRSIFCYGIFANPTNHNPLDISFDMGWRFDDARRLRKDALSSDDGLIQLGLAPNEPESSPFEAIVHDVQFAREIGARKISCHVAMGAYDQGHQFVRQLHEASLLDETFLFVHGASLTDDELKMIADAGAGLSSTPETEMQMGMGYPIGFRANAAGVKASLGVDIVSNYSGDLFSQMRMMVQSARAQVNAEHERNGRAPRRLDIHARDVLRLATLGGAEALGLDHRIGTIEVGKQADLILVRTDSIGMTPTIDPIAAVVFNASAADVSLVMVAGKIHKRDGILTRVAWPALRSQLLESSERIVAQAARVDRALVEGVVNTFFANLA
ncbi:amidohydrolase family protein [Aquisediminimonas profunda]|uniref:amidohydrolase family protein n=1 Tax=Aquisediminimonas profunda TaxID=1550733 RepID=UPI001C63B473|nr:amidohydrolase family protein [Aquisediminimonas profunda]